MSKDVHSEKYNFDNTFSKTLNWASLLIVVVCLGGLVWVVSYLTLHELKPIKNEVNIITEISKNDTIIKIKWDKYLEKIDAKVTELENVESNLNKKLDDINMFYKFLGTILAIIIAITGFFGFKSLHELKIRNLGNAKEVAKNEAILKVEAELQNLKDKTTSKIDEAKSESKLSLLSEYYKKETQIEALTGNVKEINSRLDVIENIERDFEDFNLRLASLERESIEQGDNNIKSVRKNKLLLSKPPLPEKEDKLNEEEDFGEEGFEGK